MANDIDPRELSRAAAALAETPADLGLWLRLGSLLAGAERDEAGDAFAALGEAANGLGQVALAAACARWLEQNDHGERGAALLGDVAAMHCRGSASIDIGARGGPPPSRPPIAPEPAGKGKSKKGKSKSSPAAKPPGKGAAGEPSIDDAAAAALAAIETAATDARTRAPDKLPPTALVHALTADDLRALIDASRLRALPSGSVVVDLGQPADALYWIARGRLAVHRDGALLGELRSNAFFGEIALVGGTTRTATVTCSEDTWLLELPAAQLEAVATRTPRLATVLAAHARARLLANVVRTSELFSRLSDDERSYLLSRFTTHLAEPGATIIARGQESDHLYVVVSGRCEVRDDSGVLAVVGVGDGVGEMSLIARRPAVADVVAVERTALLRLPRDEFEQLAVNHPGLLAELYKVLLEREKENKALVVHDATELVV